MDAFNFFFNNKKEIPLPEAVNKKLKPKVKLNRSFEKITRTNSLAIFKSAKLVRRNTIIGKGLNSNSLHISTTKRFSNQIGAIEQINEFGESSSNDFSNDDSIDLENEAMNLRKNLELLSP